MADQQIALKAQPTTFAPALATLREREAQAPVRAANLKTAGLQQERLGQDIELRQRELDAPQMANIFMDMSALPVLLDKGNVREAAQLGLALSDKMNQVGMNTEQFDRILAGIRVDPEGASRILKENIIPAVRPHMPNILAQVPGAGLQNLQTGQTPQGEDFTLSRGAQRFDAQGNLIAGNVPEEAPETGAAFTLTPGGQRFGPGGELIAENLRVRDPETVINLGAAETEANKEFGKGIGDRANDRIGVAQEASNQDAQLDRVLLAITEGAETGIGSEFFLDMKNIGESFFGMDFANVADQEVIRQVQNEMALRLRNPDSGLGLTGSTSNRDLEFLKASVVGLARTEGGNILMIEFMKRKNQMKRDIADEQTRLIADNDGKIPSDLDSKLLKFVDEYPLFNAQERSQLGSLGTTGVDASGATSIGRFRVQTVQ